jgi:formylglycine-generating enzyme required for sulfatase activity
MMEERECFNNQIIAALHTQRGGCWGDNARDVRSASRVGFVQSGRFGITGFRLVSGADKSEELTHE